MSVCSLHIPGIEPGLRLAVHTQKDIHISSQLAESGIWEPFETSLFTELLQAGDRCLDVGANIGYFTVLAASCVGKMGRVYSFEPAPANAELLTRNLELNGLQGHCEVEQAALSDANGSAELYLHPENLGDHQLYEAKEQRVSVTVPVVRGDDYFSEHSEAFKLVKIDTQGTEFQVVSGLLDTLKGSGPQLRIMLELTPYSLRAAGHSGRELISILDKLDLPFFIIDHIEHRLVPTTASDLEGWCDNVDEYPEDEGFMNIWLGYPPEADVSCKRSRT